MKEKKLTDRIAIVTGASRLKGIVDSEEADYEFWVSVFSIDERSYKKTERKILITIVTIHENNHSGISGKLGGRFFKNKRYDSACSKKFECDY